MPIGRTPPPPNTTGSFVPTGGHAVSAISQNAAVCVLVSAGVRVIRLCGALSTDYPLSWAGFSVSAIVSSASGAIVTGRGSIVTPLVEGSVPLVPDQRVFLSVTPGYVTQTAPSVSDSYVLRVGTAVSTTQMVLTTDSLIRNP